MLLSCFLLSVFMLVLLAAITMQHSSSLLVANHDCLVGTQETEVIYYKQTELAHTLSSYTHDGWFSAGFDKLLLSD